MKKFLKQYAPHIGASAIAITAVATAAVTPLPGSLPASVTTGGTILAADINSMIDSLNILDARTDGDAPVDDVDIVNKGYLDSAVSAVGDWQKGKICPDGEIFQGYNADESAKCETPDSLGISGGGSSSGSPDVSSTTGLGDIYQVEANGYSYVFFSDETQNADCSDFGANWKSPLSAPYSLSYYFPLYADTRAGYRDSLSAISYVCAGSSFKKVLASAPFGSFGDYFWTENNSRCQGDSFFSSSDTTDDDDAWRVCLYLD